MKVIERREINQIRTRRFIVDRHLDCNSCSRTGYSEYFLDYFSNIFGVFKRMAAVNNVEGVISKCHPVHIHDLDGWILAVKIDAGNALSVLRLEIIDFSGITAADAKHIGFR